ncbi:MAG: CAAX amino terminal protease family protein [Marinimicrobia bacterium 46_47]|nr:MAG: CAAX amino terminal protease family protein [Marinimicrobia bacterium 46_47]KUK93371.1 MAG: CAAX amino terminal protease family protein [Marinimicrobia bacterium 46_43]HBY18469.1 hypothetical protein [Candidatus Neomarinimicrobiota bacterium]
MNWTAGLKEIRENHMIRNKSLIAWSLFITLFFLGSAYAWLKFTDAFPVVNVQVDIDREEAARIARETAESQGFSVHNMRTAVLFDLDREVQYYTELEAGGKEVFEKMLTDTLYEPYTWLVRFFQERREAEYLVRLTPNGKVYGFFEKVPEDDPGPNMSESEARSLVAHISRSYNIPLTAYDEVEVSSEIKPGGRMDHVFVYERPDVTLGKDGYYRIRFTITGNKVTQIKQYVEVPEAFRMRYENMRAANRMIANIGLVAMFMVLGVGGLTGLFFLLKRHAVQWKPALYWGGGIAILQIAAFFNQWPLIWMNYDTALSKSGFVFQQVFGFILSGMVLACVMALTFAVAEGLTRMAFPRHIRLWKVWSGPVAATGEIHKQTWIGFLSAGIFFAFTTLFYLMVSRYWNWWSPASPLYDPNILAHILPWLNPLAISLQAGFWEEALFRAIPLAGAALLGERFGRKKWWIGAALVIQALIFGAAHASYANQPAFARVVELFIPSLAFGFLYLHFGLLPGVILHFVYDVVWISLPLFNTSAPGSGIHRILVILLTLFPLWIIYFHRLKLGKQEIKASFLNGNHVVKIPKIEKSPELPLKTGRITPMARGFLFLSGLLFLVIWYHHTSFENEDPGLWAGRAKARMASEAALAERGFELADSVWRVSERVVKPQEREGRFVRQSGGETGYRQLMGTFLSGPAWIVRYARFSGDVPERAEEFRIHVVGDGEIRRFIHRLPEARPAPSLSEEDAEKTAHAFLRARLGLDPRFLKKISVTPQKMPNRTDWTFTWADTMRYLLNTGEGRVSVTVSGNEISQYNPGYIHVPEKWDRDERNRETLRNLIQILSVVLLIIFLMVTAVSSYQSDQHEHVAQKNRILLGGIVFFAGLFHLWNTWPVAHFGLNPAEPLQGQIFRWVAFGVIRNLVLAFCLPLFFLLIRDFESDHMRDKPSMWIGFSAGLCGLGILAAVQSRLPFYQPVWADYSALNARIPFAYLLITRLWNFSILCVVFMILFRGVDRLTGGGVRKRAYGHMAFLSAGFGFSALFFMDTMTSWFVSGLVIFLLSNWAYRIIFRAMPSAIPFMILPFFAAYSYTQIRYEGYPGVLITEGVVLAGLFITALIFSFYLRVKQKKI